MFGEALLRLPPPARFDALDPRIKAAVAPRIGLWEPELQRYGRFYVLRDDLIFGGTKQRFVYEMIRQARAEGATELVMGGPAYGGAQVAVTLACLEEGFQSVQFAAARKEWTPRQKVIAALGAIQHPVKPGYLQVVTSRAREYVEADPRHRRLIKWGVTSTRDGIRRFAARFRPPVREVWSAFGSGTLMAGMYEAWRGNGYRYNAVVVGATKPIEEFKRRYNGAEDVTFHVYPRDFSWRNDRYPCPFPSCSHYDRKAWQIAQERSTGPAFFWNVARDIAGVADIGLQEDPWKLS
jgi:hypothetical protein